MASHGSDDDSINPQDMNVAGDHCDTLPIDFDSQYSPSVSGGDDRVDVELQYLDETVRVDSYIPAKTVFDIHKLDFDCDTRLLNLMGETQLINFEGDAQLLGDDCCGGEEKETQFIQEKENEETQLVFEKGNEETQLISPKENEETQLIFEKENEETQLICPKENEETQLICEYEYEEKERGVMGEGSDTTEVLSDCDDDGSIDVESTKVRNDQALAGEGVKPHSPGHQKSLRSNSAGSPASDNVSCSPGTAKRRFASVRVGSLRASGLAARNKMAFKVSGDDDCVSSGVKSFEQSDKDDEEKNAQVDCPTARRHLMEDLDINENDHNNCTELAGLSYVDSQEPGECSQANALAFVEQFLKVSVLDYDQDAKHGNPSEKKQDPAFSGGGAQTLAKKVNQKLSHEKPGVYDWDDELEDEGGGEFFCKMGRFGTSSRTQKSYTEPKKKPKHQHKVKRQATDPDKFRYEELHPVNVDNKMIDMAQSEPNQSKTSSREMYQGGALNVRRNLNPDMEDMQLCEEPAGQHVETEAVNDEMLYTLGVGIDTQMAAEAIEALSNEPDFSLEVTLQNEGCLGKKLKKEAAKGSTPEQHSTHKISHSTESGVALRSKRSRRGNDPLVERSRFSAVSKMRSKEAVHIVKDNMSGLEQNKVNGKKVCAQNKNLDNNDSVRFRMQCIGERENTYSPIAWRTRKKSKVITEDIGKDVTLDKPIKNMCRRNHGSILAGENQSELETGAHGLHIGRNSSIREHLEKKSDQARRSHRRDDVIVRSPVVDYTGQTITRKKRSKRIIRPADLTKYGKFYAAEAVSLLKRQMVLHPQKNDRCCSPSGERMEIKFPSERSPSEMVQPSSLACTTPVSCSLPIKASSPVCMGEEYYKMSCKKNLNESSLIEKVYNLTQSSPRCTLSDKGMRKRRDMASVRVLFSHHLDDDIIRHQKKILTRLGIHEASSITEATHFVTDEFVRTRNMLEAIARGIPVVTHLWVESCGQASCYLVEKNYILRDLKKEKEIGFSLPVSLTLASQQPLLQSKRVLITPKTKPGVEVLSSLVKAVHGKAMERVDRSIMKCIEFPDDLIVLSCEEDYEVCVPLLEKGAAIFSSELLLNGIVIQKLEFARHRLFEDHVKRTCSTPRMKKDGTNFLSSRRN